MNVPPTTEGQAYFNCDYKNREGGLAPLRLRLTRLTRKIPCPLPGRGPRYINGLASIGVYRPYLLFHINLQSPRDPVGGTTLIEDVDWLPMFVPFSIKVKGTHASSTQLHFDASTRRRWADCPIRPGLYPTSFLLAYPHLLFCLQLPPH